MSTIIKPEKKKRGRKPKNNVVVNDNPIFETINNDLIVKLQLTNLEKSFNNDIINDISNLEVKNTSYLCWNCSEPLNNSIYSIPLIYKNKIFYVYGDFCCLECGLRYARDNFDSNKYLEILTYTNLYNKEMYNNDDSINIAPHRLMLKKFGGNLTIDEYKKDNIKYGKNTLTIPIGTQLYHTFDENKEMVDNSNNSSLRLYRTKVKTTNDIKAILNL